MALSSVAARTTATLVAHRGRHAPCLGALAQIELAFSLGAPIGFAAFLLFPLATPALLDFILLSPGAFTFTPRALSPSAVSPMSTRRMCCPRSPGIT